MNLNLYVNILSGWLYLNEDMQTINANINLVDFNKNNV
jgi:hypothetical protein